jgi:hypothetical protein
VNGFTGQPGRSAAQHGTQSGYVRHRQVGEAACDECKAAHAAWRRDQVMAKREGKSLPARARWLAGMSWETTEARAAAREADRDWREHKRSCPVCDSAQRARKPAAMCAAGSDLYRDRDRAETAAEVPRQRELDRQPIPDQEVLF